VGAPGTSGPSISSPQVNDEVWWPSDHGDPPAALLSPGRPVQPRPTKPLAARLVGHGANCKSPTAAVLVLTPSGTVSSSTTRRGRPRGFQVVTGKEPLQILMD